MTKQKKISLGKIKIGGNISIGGQYQTLDVTIEGEDVVIKDKNILRKIQALEYSIPRTYNQLRNTSKITGKKLTINEKVYNEERKNIKKMVIKNQKEIIRDYFERKI